MNNVTDAAIQGGYVEVTQADREAAAQYVHPIGSGAVPVHVADLAHSMRRGRQDDHSLVQAFARHRLAASPPHPIRHGERDISYTDFRDAAFARFTAGAALPGDHIAFSEHPTPDDVAADRANDEQRAREQAVMVCPQCEGEGSYPDGLDEAACSTDCVRCGTNGWIVDVAAFESSVAGGEVEQRIAEAVT